ncbi:MAG: radical SAM protein [Thermodesulfovibrionales bacterium]
MSRRLREKAERLLSREKGTAFKDPGGKASVCLVYPNTYHVGMSNLGFQGVYRLLNGRDDVVCERAFLPDPEDLEEYERTGAELCALESGRPLGRFDIVAFSLSFENDYPNLVRILELSRIPLDSGERGPGHPLVAAGGVCAFSNPEPLAPFLDVCFIGEAEEMLHEFMDAFGKAPSRDALLGAAAAIEGVYVPRLYEVSYGGGGLISGRTALMGAPERVRRRFVSGLRAFAFGPAITTPETEFSGMFLLEAARGCPWSCSFCLAGHIYRPPRRKKVEDLRAELAQALKGTRRVGLVAPSLSDYPGLAEVLGTEGVEFSITSLRASPRSAGLVALLEGQRSVSIAPEAGTARLRRAINKEISEEDILETSRLILKQGVERLRLYFMVGLPTETDEDVEGLVGLVKRIRSLSDRGSIAITLSTFVPKPFTPFQWHPMEDPGVLKERVRRVKKSLQAEKGVRVLHDVPKYAYMQGMLAMGDRRVSAALRLMSGDLDWRRAAARAGVDPDFYAMRRKGLSEALPWDFIEQAVSKEALWEQYQRAFK